MRVLNYEQTLDLLDWDEAIAAIRLAYGPTFDAAMDPGRLLARGQDSLLRTLAGASPSGRYMGAKLFAVSHSSPRVRQLVIALFSQETGVLEALMDGRAITMYRTAATSAVAIEALCRSMHVKVAVLGSGNEARAHVRATSRVRQIEQLSVFSPTEANRQRFAEDFSRELGIECHAAATPREAVEGAGLVLAVARSRDETPILAADWCLPDATVISIGSTVPEQREVGLDMLRCATMMVCDNVREVLEESGDLIAASAEGIDMTPRTISLPEMLGRHRRGDALPDGLLLFKSIGSGLQDIVTAEAVLDKAIRNDIGTRVELDIGTVVRA